MFHEIQSVCWWQINDNKCEIIFRTLVGTRPFRLKLFCQREDENKRGDYHMPICQATIMTGLPDARESILYQCHLFLCWRESRIAILKLKWSRGSGKCLERKKNRVGLAGNQWCRIVKRIRSRNYAISPFHTSGHSSSVLVLRFYFLGNYNSKDSLAISFTASYVSLSWNGNLFNTLARPFFSREVIFKSFYWLY